jgi:hypothetical protein
MYDVIAATMESIVTAGMQSVTAAASPRPSKQIVYLLGGIQVNVSDVHVQDPVAPPEHIHSDLFLPMLFQAREWHQGQQTRSTCLLSALEEAHGVSS